jgi:hypothetical protein
MLRFPLFMAQIADSIVFWYLLYLAYTASEVGNLTDTALLVIAAVMWQRHDKAQMLDYLQRFRNCNLAAEPKNDP